MVFQQIQLMITELEKELEQKRIDSVAIERVIELLRGRDECQKQETTRAPSPRRTSVKKATAKPRKKKTKSKYKGVIVTERSDGTLYFRGNIWDAALKKTKYLGAFDSELLAAAAVQKVLGNYEEAQRLTDMAEQAKNKPDRVVGKKKGNIEKYYKCKHCGLETKTRPVQCMGCNSASFSGPHKRDLDA